METNVVFKEMARRSEHINPLVAIKLLRTVIWAILAGSILALPITALFQRFDVAMILTVIIVAECGVLALNRGQCPLTGLAARFTSDPADNFDIYLPISSKLVGTRQQANLRHAVRRQRTVRAVGLGEMIPIFMGRRSIRRQSDCDK
jgi:hypothetical protein